MIQLTRLNCKPLTMNSDRIKFVEESPDTLVTLITDETIVVREKAAEVLARIIEFRRSLQQSLSSTWDPSSAHALIARSSETERCGRRMKELKTQTLGEYFEGLTIKPTPQTELIALLNEITIGETCFFRSQPQLDALRQTSYMDEVHALVRTIYRT
jgi:flagellar protein FlbD